MKFLLVCAATATAFVLVVNLTPANTNTSAPVVAQTTAPKSAPVTTKEDDKRNGLSLAGTLANFAQYCPREFAALTPQLQDAVVTFVAWEIRDHGKDAVDQATTAGYENGYYRLGDRWCSIGASTAKSIARAMTR